MDWQEISKLGTANLAIVVIGVILWKQTEALQALADNLLILVQVYSGHLSPVSAP